MAKSAYVSAAVVRRLPRYYRFLCDLLDKGITRISSRELAEIMNLTASQIRQDLNCFGGFGQQGYGYNVDGLRGEIRNILGLDYGFTAIAVGIGNLGRAVINHMELATSGFELKAIFDKDIRLIGQTVSGRPVQPMEELENYCLEHRPDVAILCIPKEAAQQVAGRLISAGVNSFWNFSHYDISLDYPTAIVENVHMNDSLMTLCYQVKDAKNGGSASR